MERDVSITSGTMIAKALSERGHNVVLVDSFFGYTEPYDKERPEDIFLKDHKTEIIKVKEKEPDLEAVRAKRRQGNNSTLGDNVLEICRKADITFFALHGDDGENGKMQAVFDIAGIKYTGSGYLGSALAMNKRLSKDLFTYCGILTPPWISVCKEEAHYADIGFPCVVKPCSGGSSVGTSIVFNREEYKGALELAFKYENTLIVEKYIKGRELTVGVIDGKAMPVIEIIPKTGFYDYKNKYQAGLTSELCPAPLSEEDTIRIQRLGVRAHEVLMIDVYSRIDFLMDEKGDIYCMEANTLPGMTSTSLIPRMALEQGKSFGELCEEIIEVSKKKYDKA